MGFDWNSFSASSPINYSQLGSAMELLSKTSKVHEERDLAFVSPKVLKTLINTLQGYQPPFPSPIVKKYNWMQVDYGTNKNDNDIFKGHGDIVVIYRLLKHRIQIARKMQWSVTVGFDERLLPPPINQNQTEYKELANIFASQIRDKQIHLDPIPEEYVMVDDIPSNQDDPSKSKVGNLILTAYSLADGRDYAKLKAAWTADPADYIPKSEHGQTIPGYNPPDGYIRVTTIKPA